MEEKNNVYVVYHNLNTQVLKSSPYMPLQVNSSAHPEMYAGIGCKDSSGDSISFKNGNYCELTGLYWIWKNHQYGRWAGLCHYRRYLKGKKKLRIDNHSIHVIDTDEIESCLKANDIIVAQRFSYKTTIYRYYAKHHHSQDLDAVRDAIKLLYPDYMPSFDKVMNGNYMHGCNMFIARRDVFEAYCNWLFTILKEVENHIDVSSYDNYNKRVFGFLSERLLDVYIDHNNLKYVEKDIVLIGNPFFALYNHINNFKNNRIFAKWEK